MNKPRLKDFPEYYRRYIAEVIDKDIIGYLNEQKKSTVEFFTSIGEEKSLNRYAADKWSIKEILGHICDAERLFFARAIHFARSEKQHIPGFDENDYVEAADFDSVPFDILIEDFVKMRDSHLSLFKTFTENVWERKGIANETEYTVTSVLYIVAGHLDHHVKVIKERYL